MRAIPRAMKNTTKIVSRIAKNQWQHQNLFRATHIPNSMIKMIRTPKIMEATKIAIWTSNLT